MNLEFPTQTVEPPIKSSVSHQQEEKSSGALNKTPVTAAAGTTDQHEISGTEDEESRTERDVQSSIKTLPLTCADDSKKIELNPEALAATPSLGAVKTCVSEKASFCAPSHVPGEKDAIDLRKNAENDKNEMGPKAVTAKPSLETVKSFISEKSNVLNTSNNSDEKDDMNPPASSGDSTAGAKNNTEVNPKVLKEKIIQNVQMGDVIENDKDTSIQQSPLSGTSHLTEAAVGSVESRDNSRTPSENNASERKPAEPSKKKVGSDSEKISEEDGDKTFQRASSSNSEIPIRDIKSPPKSTANEEGKPAEPSRNKVSSESKNEPSEENRVASIQPSPRPNAEVIDLLDDSDNETSERATKRQKLSENKSNNSTQLKVAAANAARASYEARASNLPQWMAANHQTPSVNHRHQGPYIQSASSSLQIPSTSPSQVTIVPPTPHPGPKSSSAISFEKPHYITFKAGFTPTWAELVPGQSKSSPPAYSTQRNFQNNGRKYFQLSLLNVSEFTITGLPVVFDGPPTPVSGLRVIIKQISRQHGNGKAFYERNKDSAGGKWRIPLGAYYAFEAYLRSDPLCQVDGIPHRQLKIASVERLRQEKGYPTAQKLINVGIPEGLANTLAPFQRGGVDFILEKHGRALLADDMGLGKTIQGVASMSAYHKEWPLLVLCPSSARYHWESEFLNWLGDDKAVLKGENKRDCDVKMDAFSVVRNRKTRPDKCPLLTDSQIHVLTSSKEPIFPTKSTRVVICSYGLAPMLVKSGKIYPRLFRCAIVDESHMLKNKSTKRTSTLLPILQATDRCILLSGTPAMARPAELWPQLLILSKDNDGIWTNETEFFDKYVKRADPQRRAELHTMLTGTVMIRRLKSTILKTLPTKVRNKAYIHVLNNEQHAEFKKLLIELRRGKGALGAIARKHHAEFGRKEEEEAKKEIATGVAFNDASYIAAHTALKLDLQKQEEEGRGRINQWVANAKYELTEQEVRSGELQMLNQLQREIHRVYQEGTARINGRPTTGTDSTGKEASEENNRRATLLSRLYSLTGDVKVPLVVDMLKRWLKDKTKGKVVIFAHHLAFLDSLENLAGLSNEDRSTSKYIRIDGSTSPKARQQQINIFQNDPSVRVALMGITAAGVAVTVTASSTVWFAELFWTPAILIQAEDRCHRIGQQSQVSCLYFVARGTLDDILWRLVEKKFQDLGEFVEGKEKLKIVVDTTYGTTKELHAMFEIPDDCSENSEDEAGADDDLISLSKELELDSDLVKDIDLLGKKEQNLFKSLEGDEDEVVGTANENPEIQEENALKITEEKEGETEDKAITLLDDDDDDEAVSNNRGGLVEHAVSSPAPAKKNGLDAFVGNPKIFQIAFRGRLGLEVAFFYGRVVVCRILEDRIKLLGPNSKPAVGDIFVAVNGNRLPLFSSFAPAYDLLKHCLTKNPESVFCFAELPKFIDYYRGMLAKRGSATKKGEQAVQHAPKRPPPTTSPVIDLLDD